MGKRDRHEDHDARVRGTVDLILGYYVQDAATALGDGEPSSPATERQAQALASAET